MGILNDYMAMSYRMEIVEDKDEGGFVNFYPDLPGCIRSIRGSRWNICNNLLEWSSK